MDFTADINELRQLQEWSYGTFGLYMEQNYEPYRGRLQSQVYLPNPEVRWIEQSFSFDAGPSNTA